MRQPVARTVVLVAIGAIALAVLLAFAAVWSPLRARAEAGVAYGARLGCSCRFVAGRPLGECVSDFEPGMATVRLSENAGDKSVTARVLLLATDTARFVPGAGCRLDPWRR